MTVLAASEDENGRLATPTASRPLPAKWICLGAFAVLGIPVIVAVAVLHSPRWYPLLDWAQTEIRVRDVWSSHPPLIGLAGRIGPFGPNGGSHPGPLSFYALWPVWKVFGSSSYGLHAGNGVLDLAAIGLVIWMAYRRGGAPMVVGIAAVLALVMNAYGYFLLTLPWNPYLPVMWWFVFLMAAWSIVDDDLAMLPVAAFAGAFAMQTHISYLGLISGLSAFLVVWVVWRAKDRRALRRYGISAIAITIVLWIPPVIDQIRHSPSNFETIRDYFSNPPKTDKPIGFGRGISVLLTQLNPLKLFTGALVSDGNPRPVAGTRLLGVLLLILWIVSVYVAWRARDRLALVLKLDLVVGVALVLGFISAGRINGEVWYYLLLWAWALTALMLFAVTWTAFTALRVNAPPRSTVLAVVAAVAVVAVVLSSIQAAQTDVMSPRLNEQMAALMRPTVARVEALKRQGVQGPYFVTWLPEAQAIGAEGYALQNELLRHGLDARAAEVFRPGSTRYHVMDPADAKIQVHLATGIDIPCWQDDARYQQIAYFDPRTGTERASFDALHAQVVSDLQREGHADLVPQVDNNLFMLALLKTIPAPTRKLMSQMLAFGLPAAIFIGPPDARPRSARPECQVQ